eukprot:g53990.t1
MGIPATASESSSMMNIAFHVAMYAVLFMAILRLAKIFTMSKPTGCAQLVQRIMNKLPPIRWCFFAPPPFKDPHLTVLVGEERAEHKKRKGIGKEQASDEETEALTIPEEGASPGKKWVRGEGGENASAVVRERKPKPGTRELVECTVGLLVSYVTWGYFQERIMTIEYGAGERFTNSEFLVLANRMCAMMVASFMNWWTRTTERPKGDSKAPPWKYSISSISNVLSSWFQYEALKFVSFPLQVLSKSCKIIAAMIMGKIMYKKKYPYKDYIMSLLLMAGLTIYKVSERGNSAGAGGFDENHHIASLVTGVFLLASYVLADAFTSNWQEGVLREHKGCKNDMMWGINLFSSLFTTFVLVSSGRMKPSIMFIVRHPACLTHVILMSFCSAMGQTFIFNTIAMFGAVTFACIMTFRQLFSIILSLALFGHTIGPGGLFGLFVVFSTLGYGIWETYRDKQAARREDKSDNIFPVQERPAETIQLVKMPTSDGAQSPSSADNTENKSPSVASYTPLARFDSPLLMPPLAAKTSETSNMPS